MSHFRTYRPIVKGAELLQFSLPELTRTPVAGLRGEHLTAELRLRPAARDALLIGNA